MKPVTIVGAGKIGGMIADLLGASGDYRVRVFLNRAAARQGKSATYTLKISVVN